MAVIRDEYNYKAIEHNYERMTLVKEWRDTVHFISWYTQSFVIRFLNYDETVLQESVLEAWEMPVYTGRTPTKPGDEEFVYNFTWWNPEITVVDWDKNYTAQFEAVPAPERHTYEFKDYWALSKWTYITTAQQLSSAGFSTTTDYQFYNWDITISWVPTHVEWLIWKYDSSRYKYNAVWLSKLLTSPWDTLKKLTLDFWMLLDVNLWGAISSMDTIEFYKEKGIYQGTDLIMWQIVQQRWNNEVYRHRSATVWEDISMQMPEWFDVEHQRRYQIIIDFENWTMTRRVWKDIDSFHNWTSNWWDAESVEMAIPDIETIKSRLETKWLLLELKVPESSKRLADWGYVTAFQYISYVIE